MTVWEAVAVIAASCTASWGLGYFMGYAEGRYRGLGGGKMIYDDRLTKGKRWRR